MSDKDDCVVCRADRETLLGFVSSTDVMRIDRP